MSEDLALVSGAGAAWFAGKIFGPSAEAMGQNLRAYLADRMPRIFGKAEEIAKQQGVKPQPIKPGLLARMIADASFSEDAPDITEWWANLFVDASISGSNEHAVFADMMALLGPAEVKCLAKIMADNPRFQSMKAGKNFTMHIGPDEEIEDILKKYLAKSPFTDQQILIDFQKIETPSTIWPIKITSFDLPIERDGEIFLAAGGTHFHDIHHSALEVLKRADILIDVNVGLPFSRVQARLRGVSVTSLGFDFYQACTGSRLTASATP